MKIAMVTPWPDDKSGIAEYAFDLTAGLIRSGDYITVFTRATNAEPLEGCNIISGDDTHNWDLNGYDLVIYHFGNNITFHEHMPSLITDYPGIVHLHDYVLQHLYAGVANKNDDWEGYFQLVKKYYPAKILEKIQESFTRGFTYWERGEVLDCPLNDEAINKGYGVIVHSKFAAKNVSKRIKSKPLAIINQAYKIGQYGQYKEHRKSKSEFVIGVFGHVQKNKCVLELVEALSDLSNLKKKVRLKLVGEVLDKAYFSKVEQAISKLSDQISCEFTGFVNEEEFNRQISQVDLCVALRNPTMGETSAVVVKAIQAGTPVIVSNHGWYSELPSCIPKIPVSSSLKKVLISELEKMVNDEVYYRSAIEDIHYYSESQYNYERIIELYQDVIHKMHQFRKKPPISVDSIISDSLSKKFIDLDLCKPLESKDIRQKIYDKLRMMI